LDALKLKTANSLMYSIHGGTFKINRELISFVELLVNDKQTGAFLLDINDLPIFIDDLVTFSAEIYTRYFETMNDYGEEYARIRKARKVATIADLEEEGTVSTGSNSGD